MPIYEFYCDACNLLLNFFSARIDTAAAPACPHCGKERLERRPARFAVLQRTTGGDEGEGDELFPGVDEARMEQAMEAMAGEMESLGDDEDPRQMARFFRRFGEAAGMRLGPRMEEMLRRLESGEDPDALEDELGGPGEGEDDDEGSLDDWFELKQKAAALRRSARRPRVDETLYFL